MTRLRKKEGITLIALIVTIVVLLILAGVTIAAIGGDNGLIAKSKEAVNESLDMEKETADKRDNLYNEITGKKDPNKVSVKPEVSLSLEAQDGNTIKATAVATETENDIVSYRYYIKKKTEDDSAYVRIQTEDPLSQVATCSGLETNLAYTVKVVVTDKSGNQKDVEDYIQIGNDFVTIIVESTNSQEAYPDILSVKALSSVANIKNITLPNGEVITPDGKKMEAKTTYNATMNGPLIFKAEDEDGNTVTYEYIEKNVISFETEWAIYEDDTTVTVPVTGNVNLYIDYGDGTVESVEQENPMHTYKSAGRYTMKISGQCTAFEANDSTFNHLTQIKKWGCLSNQTYKFGEYIDEDARSDYDGEMIYDALENIVDDDWIDEIKDMYYNEGWRPCINLRGNIPEPHSKSFKNLTDCEMMFFGCAGLSGSIPDNLFANCTEVTTFRGTFGNCFRLVSSIPENLFVNCKNVEDFGKTFYYCINLTGDIPENLFESCTEVVDFSYTFAGMGYRSAQHYNEGGKFETIEIPEKLFANCSKVITFEGAFEFCSNLYVIPAELFINCTEVTNFSYTFFNMGPKFIQPQIALSYSMTSSNHQYMSEIPEGLFVNCNKVTTFECTFAYCDYLTGSIPKSLFENCSNVTNFGGTFEGCEYLTGDIPESLFANCPEVTDFSYTFYNCNNLTGSIPENLFANCPNVTSFYATFEECSGLTGSIPENLFANCPNVTDFRYTFFKCSGLTESIPENLFANCPNVTSFYATFEECSGLTGSIPENLFANCPNVTEFYSTFDNCSGLTGSIPEKLFANCPNVTSFSSTFEFCYNLSGSIPENLFANCPNVTSFHATFEECSGLTGSIPENLFANCPNVKYFNSTFYGCTNLTGTAPSLWERTNVKSFYDCFGRCSKLTNYSSIPSDWK